MQISDLGSAVRSFVCNHNDWKNAHKFGDAPNVTFGEQRGATRRWREMSWGEKIAEQILAMLGNILKGTEGFQDTQKNVAFGSVFCD